MFSHYLMKLVVTSQRSIFVYTDNSSHFLFCSKHLNVLSDLKIFSFPSKTFAASIYYKQITHSAQTLSVYQYASLRERERERERKDICLQSKFLIYLVHIIHIMLDARLVLRFHRFHRRFSHESRLVSVTHAVAFKFQPLSVCTCFILI